LAIGNAKAQDAEVYDANTGQTLGYIQNMYPQPLIRNNLLDEMDRERQVRQINDNLQKIQANQQAQLEAYQQACQQAQWARAQSIRSSPTWQRQYRAALQRYYNGGRTVHHKHKH